MAFDANTFQTDVLTAITAIDGGVTSFTTDDISSFYGDWIRAAWDTGCSYADTQDPGQVVEGAISGGAITTEDDAYWGMNHFKTDFKDAILTGTTLFPYRGLVPQSAKVGVGNDIRSRIFVVSNAKIFKFTNLSANYFDAVRDSVHHYMAEQYFTHTVSGNANGTNANTAGDDGDAGYNSSS